MALRLKHQSKVQFLKRWRDKYRDAKGAEACRVAHRILKYLEDGDVTAAEIQNAWNITAGEWAIRATHLQAKANKWLAIKSAEVAAENEAGN